MSWATFHSKQYSRTLKNYSKRLQDYMNYYS
jgi:hypothetical protein